MYFEVVVLCSGVCRAPRAAGMARRAARHNALDTVGAWHLDMLLDDARCSAFAHAVAAAAAGKAASGDGALVLDVGAGSGLLAMVAASARPGVRAVAVEAQVAAAEAAEVNVQGMHARRGLSARAVCPPERRRRRRRAPQMPREFADTSLPSC